MTKNKNCKPVEYDIHLKYICYNCGQVHWLSFLEASTKNFKIACYCGKVFQVKRVSAFKIKYIKKSKILNKQATKPKTPKTYDTLSKEKILHPDNQEKIKVPENLLNQCVKLLVNYGYGHKEAIDLISKSYQKKPTDNVVELIKQTLKLDISNVY